MTLRSRVLVAVVVLLLVAASCSDDDASESTTPPDWPTFTDPGTGISYRLPGEHESTTQRVQLPDGTPSEIVVYRYPDGDRELIVSTFPLDPESFELDGAPSGAAEAVAGDLVDVQTVETAGHPSRQSEIHFEREGVDWVLFNRAVLTDDGLVQFQVSGPRTDRDELLELHDQLVAGFG